MNPRLTTARVFLAIAIGGLLGTIASAQTPQAAAFALTSYSTIHPEPNRLFVRWIYSPSGTKEDHDAYLIAINTTWNHSSVSYIAPQIRSQNGLALIPVDFTKLADTKEEVHRLLSVWDRLAIQDPHFHETLFVDGLSRIRPARHLGEVGIELENLFPRHSNGRPQLTLPIAYGPWMLVKMLASVDGGVYLEARGLTPGKTKLEEYLKSRGASFEEAKRLNAVERLGLISHIAGFKARGVNYYHGQGVRPTAGRPLVFITDDIFDENVSPNSNALTSLVESKPDGHEVFVVLPNGWIEFTLFNGDGILVSEAPMGSPKFLVSDNRVPKPFAPRLHGAISCLRCHGPHDGYQPVQNEVADRIRAFGVLSHSLKGDALKQFEQLKQIGFLYGAKQIDINAVLFDARDGFSRRINEVTGIKENAAKLGCESVSALYASYEYTLVDAKLALERAGVPLQQNDPLGLTTMQSLAPVDAPIGLYNAEAIDTMLHLASASIVVEGKELKQVPLKVHPRQWERAVATIQLRVQEQGNQ